MAFDRVSDRKFEQTSSQIVIQSLILKIKTTITVQNCGTNEYHLRFIIFYVFL